MIDYFLNTKDKQKIKLFNTILLSSTGISTKELSNKFKLKDETLRRYTKELQNDLHMFFNNDVSLIEDSDRKLKIIHSTILSPDHIITSLNRDYLKNSSFYILLSSLIKKKYYSVPEIAYDLNFSEPTVYKILAQIKNLISPFKIRISFSSPNNFEGDELGVRFFLYLTYWYLFNLVDDKPFSENFPSEFINIDFIKKNLNIKKKLTNSQEKRLIIMSGIFSYRIVFFQKYESLSKEFFEDISPFSVNNVSLDLESFNVPTDIIVRESTLFNFVVRGLISGLDNQNDINTLVKNYTDSTVPLSTEISYFLKQFKRILNFNSPLKKYTESYYILIFLFGSTKYFSYDADHYFSVPIMNNLEELEDSSNYQELKSKLELLLKYVPNYKKFHSSQKETFIHYFNILYKLNIQYKPIKIYVSHSLNIVNPIYIQETILTYFNKDQFNFCENFEEADIIISNSSEIYYSKKTIFYFENIYDKNNWSNLFQFLTNFLLNQNF